MEEKREKLSVCVRVRCKHTAGSETFAVHFSYGGPHEDVNEMEVKLPEKLDLETAGKASSFSGRVYSPNGDSVFYNYRTGEYRASMSEKCILCTTYCSNTRTMRDVVRRINAESDDIDVTWKGDTDFIQGL